MELSLRTSPSSYVVCGVIVRGYDSGDSTQVMVRIVPRDKKTHTITFDLSIGDSLDLIAAITSELRRQK